LQGDKGLSRKGATEGNASYYYSFSRLSTSGTLTVEGKSFQVSGNSWMDHEFSSSFLEPKQVGWDWFSIQLHSGVDLMLYRMRRADGTADEFSSGSLVSANGEVTQLKHADFTLSPLQTWRSPETSADYPVHWQIELPRLGYRLRVRPAFDQQEMTTDGTTGINYWEGSIEVEGEGPQGSELGRGYLEMTGYTGRSLGSLFDSTVDRGAGL
jgi:predicted secreted hydrolase